MSIICPHLVVYSTPGRSVITLYGFERRLGSTSIGKWSHRVHLFPLHLRQLEREQSGSGYEHWICPEQSINLFLTQVTN